MTTTGKAIAAHGRSARSNSRSRGASAPRARPSYCLRSPSWAGILPFAAYMIVFLGLPLYVVIHGSVTTESNQFTWDNFKQTWDSPGTGSRSRTA